MEQLGLIENICGDSASQPERMEVENTTCEAPSEPSSLMSHFEESNEKNTPILTAVAASVEQLPHDNFGVTAPWIHDVQSRSISLEEELVLFARYVELTEEEQAARLVVQTEVERVVRSLFPDVCVTLFGSHQLGLTTFLSDIDLSISMSTTVASNNLTAVQAMCTTSSTSDEEEDAEEGRGVPAVQNTHDEEPRSADDHKSANDKIVGLLGVSDVHPGCLKSLYRTLKSKPWVDRIEHRKKARVPIVNLTHKNGVECDVSLDMSQQATSLVVRTLMQRSGPALATLSAFLKIYLSQLGLDAPFTGGLGSYKLYVLLAKHIESHPALTTGPEGPLLGDLLISFFNHYRRRKNFHEDLLVEIAGVEVYLNSVHNLSAVRVAFERAYFILTEDWEMVEGTDCAEAPLPEGEEEKEEKEGGRSACACPRSALALLLNVEHLTRFRAQCLHFVSDDGVPADSAVASSSATKKPQTPPALWGLEHLLSFPPHDTVGPALCDDELQRLAADMPLLAIQDNAVSKLMNTFHPSNSVGKLVISGRLDLPKGMAVSPQSLHKLPPHLVDALGPFHMLCVAEQFHHKSYEVLVEQDAREEAAVQRVRELCAAGCFNSCSKEHAQWLRRVVLSGALGSRCCEALHVSGKEGHWVHESTAARRTTDQLIVSLGERRQAQGSGGGDRGGDRAGDDIWIATTLSRAACGDILLRHDMVVPREYRHFLLRKLDKILSVFVSLRERERFYSSSLATLQRQQADRDAERAHWQELFHLEDWSAFEALDASARERVEELIAQNKLAVPRDCKLSRVVQLRRDAKRRKEKVTKETIALRVKKKEDRERQRAAKRSAAELVCEQASVHADLSSPPSTAAMSKPQEKRQRVDSRDEEEKEEEKEEKPRDGPWLGGCVVC